MQPSDNQALVLGRRAHAAKPLPDAPRLSAACAEPLREISAVDEAGAARPLLLPMERPLTLAIDGRELVTLMTLGAAPEWLAVGFLYNQRLIDRARCLESVEIDWQRSAARICRRPGEAPPAAAQVAAGAPGCALGTAFDEWMSGTTALPAAPGARAAAPGPEIPAQQILAILDSMRQHDAIHRAAGSVHSCALFEGGELWMAIEDVSRHNGMDSIAGFMLLHGIGGADKVIFSTGRLTAEMVMKGAHNGVAVMISRNGTTALGCELAARLGMTLIGRAAGSRYVCYTGSERIRGGGPHRT